MMGMNETEDGMNIHVGNLSPSTSLSDLVCCFTAFGLVTNSTITTFEIDGEPRSIGFIEMPSNIHALAAIADLKDKKLDGRQLKVREE